MTRPRSTIADIAARYAEMDEHDPRGIHEVLTPTEGGILLFRTSTSGCLTHIARFVVHSTASYRDFLLLSVEAECGVRGVSGWRRWKEVIVVEPGDETFGCHVCIARCEKLDLPTYNLIPDTGCSATGGVRYRPKASKDLTDSGPCETILTWEGPVKPPNGCE